MKKIDNINKETTQNKTEQSVRIQTSVLSKVEKRILIWLAQRQPKWVNSDMLTFLGTIGALTIAAGYILSNKNIHFLWIASFGFIVNWYGDSLDGTLARVRHCQRPNYGYYLDHSIDAINEIFMFIGIGLSSFLDIRIAMAGLIIYFLLTINVSINAHLKGEFRLTYAKMGPTEFRIIMIILNTLIIYWEALRERMNIIGLTLIGLLFIIYVSTLITDAKGYAKMDNELKNRHKE